MDPINLSALDVGVAACGGIDGLSGGWGWFQHIIMWPGIRSTKPTQISHAAAVLCHPQPASTWSLGPLRMQLIACPLCHIPHCARNATTVATADRPSEHSDSRFSNMPSLNAAFYSATQRDPGLLELSAPSSRPSLSNSSYNLLSEVTSSRCSIRCWDRKLK